MDSLPPPACLQCGTCCYSHLETYVQVTGADWLRLGGHADRVAHFIGHRAYMRMSDGHCAALQPDTANGTYRCSVYDVRPQTCRDLERGSPACLAEWTLKGERPRASVGSAT